MSTRGNYVFCEVPLKVDDDLNYVRGGDGSFILDHDELKQLEKTVDDDLLTIKYGHKVYVHSDNYPSGAIPPLLEFLNTNGAKSRVNDESYLAAWFVTYKCLEVLPFARSFGDKDYDWRDCTNPSFDDLAKSGDFFGVGLETTLSSWCDYTYVICPELKSLDGSETTGKSVIYVYESNYQQKNFKFVDKFVSDIDIAELEAKYWYH